MGNDDEEQYKLMVEELIAMQIKHISSLTKEQAKRQIKDLAVTIPPWFGFEERVALSDAVKIAGLNPIAFITENTAAALYNCLTRDDKEPFYTIFFNLGSSGLKVSLVEYSQVNSTSKTSSSMVQSYKVLSDAWDSEINSRTLDIAVAKKIGEEFDNMKSRKGQKSIFSSYVGKAKLLKEGKRVKETLSANKNVPIYAESLFDGADFKGSLDRQTFDELGADVFNGLTKPIDEVLKKAGKTLKDIHAFEVIGGGVRTPKVQ